MTIRTTTTQPGDGSPEFRTGADAAASLRRLHHLQMAILVIAAAGIAVAALLFFRALDDFEERKASVGNAVFNVSRAFEDMRAAQILLQREGDRPALIARMRDATTAAHAVMSEQRDATDGIVDPATRRAGDETLAALDRLITRGAPWAAGADPSRAATPLGDDLAPVTERWIAGLQAKRLSLNSQLDATITRSRHVLVGLIVSFGLLAMGLWVLLGRQRGRLVASLQRTSHEQAAMREMVTAATWAQTSSVADVAAAQVAQLLDADQVVVGVRTSDADEDRIAFPSTELPPLVAATRDAVTARAVTLSETSTLTDDSGDATAVCVVGDGPDAACRTVCAVWGPGSTPPRGAGHTLRRLAETLELAIQAALARERMSTQATTDHLTGLPNHRSFQEHLVEEVARAQDAGRPLALVVLDVDAFGHVNDAYGHEAGDRVLAELGLRLRGLSREGDTLARIGGEEFAWLMPGVTAATARAAADRARGAARCVARRWGWPAS
ncbi:MAG: GGDEF domain-containing protein [Thermoleophilia bacterium]|nr:GGDEF domain-containing protein [Thermoleophilia bacterium]